MFTTTQSFTVEEVKKAKREMNEKIQEVVFEFIKRYGITELDVKVHTGNDDKNFPIPVVTVESKAAI